LSGVRDNDRVPDPADGEHRIFRPGGVSYLRIPAADPATLVPFYEAVFGWEIRTDGREPSFEDGTGHVIGHFTADTEVSGEAGVRPYVFVESVDEVLERVAAGRGEVVEEPYPEGDLWVATFRDPSGNVVGAWQRGPRNRTQ
jgi:predicted enzyme related to lactoylglutathione lyase